MLIIFRRRCKCEWGEKPPRATRADKVSHPGAASPHPPAVAYKYDMLMTFFFGSGRAFCFHFGICDMRICAWTQTQMSG